MAISSLAELHSTLANLDWQTDDVHKRVGELYGGLGLNAVRQLVANAFDNEIVPGTDQFQEYLTISSQKPTHAKIFLGQGEYREYRLWLHNYGQHGPDYSDGDYVEQFHNHRYDFTSMIMREGYTADEMIAPSSATLNEQGFWEPGTDWWPAAVTYTAGDIVDMRGRWDIHRLRAIGKNTLTLVTEGPRLRGASQGFSEDGKVVADYPDFINRYEELRDRLSSL